MNSFYRRHSGTRVFAWTRNDGRESQLAASFRDSGKGPSAFSKTSIFPDKKRGGYLLPLKAAVRTKEKIELGNTVAVTIELLT